MVWAGRGLVGVGMDRLAPVLDMMTGGRRSVAAGVRVGTAFAGLLAAAAVPGALA